MALQRHCVHKQVYRCNPVQKQCFAVDGSNGRQCSEIVQFGLPYCPLHNRLRMCLRIDQTRLTGSDGKRLNFKGVFAYARPPAKHPPAKQPPAKRPPAKRKQPNSSAIWKDGMSIASYTHGFHEPTQQWVFIAEKLTQAEMSHRYPTKQSFLHDVELWAPYVIKLQHGCDKNSVFIDNICYRSIACLANSPGKSDLPANAIIRQTGCLNTDPVITLIATRDIFDGDEILCKYDESGDDDVHMSYTVYSKRYAPINTVRLASEGYAHDQHSGAKRKTKGTGVCSKHRKARQKENDQNKGNRRRGTTKGTHEQRANK